jgi:hypothetical protein
LSALSVYPAASFAALAKKAGAAGTSSTTSTNPTVKQQSQLMDPSVDDLQLTFARLDLEIQYTNVPDHLEASNLIESIAVTPEPNFEAVPGEPLPSYDGSTATISSFHVDMDQSSDGRTVFIHDIAVQEDPADPPPFGEVNHALVTIQYFNFLTDAAYDGINATFTVFASNGDSDENIPPSLIEAKDADGNVFDFSNSAPDPNNPDDPDNDGTILPSTSSEDLGAPEPMMLGPLAVFALGAIRKRRNVC